MFFTQNTDPSVRNLPFMLTPDRIIDPYPILDHFFYPGDSLPEIRSQLMKWLVAAISGEKKWKRDGLVKCLYSFIYLHALIEALWIIHERGDRMTKKQILKRGDPLDVEMEFSRRVQERVHYLDAKIEDFDPDYLTPSEELMPFDIIHQFFAQQDLFEARNKLSLWNSTAIACHHQYEPMKREDLIVFHRLLIRAVEAAFIIVEIRIANKIIEDIK